MAVIVGEALILGRPVLLAYAGAVWAVVAAFARWYEEPTLARTFGASYGTTDRRSRPGVHAFALGARADWWRVPPICGGSAGRGSAASRAAR